MVPSETVSAFKCRYTFGNFLGQLEAGGPWVPHSRVYWHLSLSIFRFCVLAPLPAVLLVNANHLRGCKAQLVFCRGSCDRRCSRCADLYLQLIGRLD